MTVTVLAFALAAVLQQPTSIVETPEWKSYQAKLREMPSYRVIVHSAVRTKSGRTHAFLVEPWESVAVMGSASVIENSRAITYLRPGRETTFAKGMASEAHQDRFLRDVLGLGSGRGEQTPQNAIQSDTLDRLTAIQMHSSRSHLKRSERIGWRSRTINIDHPLMAEYWWDTETRLLQGVTIERSGTGADYQISLSLEWDLNPAFADDYFNPRPPPKEPQDSRQIYYRLLPQGKLRGHGRVTVTLPPGCTAAIEIDRTRLTGSGRLEMDLPEGRYLFAVDGTTLAFPVNTGFETRFDLAAIVWTGNSPLHIRDSLGTPWILRRRNGNPVAILPGTYDYEIDGKKRRVVVEPGKTTRIDGKNR